MANLPYYEFYSMVDGENGLRARVEVENNTTPESEAGLVQAIKAYMMSLPNYQGGNHVRKDVAGTPV